MEENKSGFKSFLNSVKQAFGKKLDPDAFQSISIVESYNSDQFQIENIGSYYKLITKISAIPKSLDEISQTIISKKYSIRDKKSEKEIKNVPEELKQLIEKPHSMYNFIEFVMLIITDCLIAGNVFGYLVNDKDAMGKKRLSIRRIDPRYVQYMRGQWWENNPYGGIELLDPKFFIHVKHQPDNLNPRWGKGIIANNLMLFTRCMRILEFTENFYANGCHPTAVISIENGGAMDQKRVENLLKEKRGSKNAGAPLVLSGKVSYEQIQLDPSVLKISDELSILYKEVMAAFGLPRFLMEVGLRDAGQKYNNHELQMEHFIKSVIIPIAKRIESFFNNIVERYNPEWEFHFDINQEIYTAIELQAMLDAGTITRAEHRLLMSLPESKNKDLETFFIPSGYQTLEAAIEGIVDPVLDPTSITAPANPNATPLKPGEPKEPPKESEPPKEPPKKKIDNGRERDHGWRDEHYLSEPVEKVWTIEEIKATRNQKRIRQDFVTLNAKTRAKKTKEAELKFNLYLMDAYGNILAQVAKHAYAIEELSKPEGKGEKNDPTKLIEEIYNAGDDLKKIEKISLPLYLGIGEATYSNTANVLTTAVAFNVADPGVAAMVDLLRKDGPLVTQTTKGKLTETLTAGIESGKTHNEIAKDIWLRFVDENNDLADEFAKIYRPGVKPKDFDAVMTRGGKLQSRATLIARTEVARANRLFAAESMKSSSVVKTVTIINCEPGCPICGPHQNVEVTFEEADSISNLHSNCSGSLVPGTISID